MSDIRFDLWEVCSQPLGRDRLIGTEYARTLDELLDACRGIIAPRSYVTKDFELVVRYIRVHQVVECPWLPIIGRVDDENHITPYPIILKCTFEEISAKEYRKRGFNGVKNFKKPMRIGVDLGNIFVDPVGTYCPYCDD